MKNILFILKRQFKDTLNNKAVLIQFIMFPVLVIIMNNTIDIPDAGDNFFVRIFGAMFIGMAPLSCMAAIVAEEKEKNTLRVLLMSNVKPWQYFIGVGSYIGIACMVGSFVFCWQGHYTGLTAVRFLAIMAVGIVVSLLIGAAIGTWSSNQMSETSVSIPVMLVFSMFPMLSYFNKGFAMVAKFTYSEQISQMLSHMADYKMSGMTIAVIVGNLLIAAFLFRQAYRKCGIA